PHTPFRPSALLWEQEVGGSNPPAPIGFPVVEPNLGSPGAYPRGWKGRFGKLRFARGRICVDRGALWCAVWFVICIGIKVGIGLCRLREARWRSHSRDRISRPTHTRCVPTSRRLPAS